MFSILHPVEDAAQWRELIGRLPPELRDVHYSPEYAEVQRMLGFDPLLAVYEWRGDFVLMPFITKTNSIDGRRSVDIASPYGYGGPLCSIPVRRPSAHLARWFNEGFEKFAATQGFVTEFCALHPMMVDYQGMLLSSPPDRRKNVVVIDVATWRPEDCRGDRVAGFHAAEKNNILAGQVPALPQVVENFIDLYRSTMLRRNAAQRWYFPDEYLRAYCAMPQAKLFCAMAPESPIEVLSLVLIEHGTAYYHLTGNAMKMPKVGANDALIASVIDYCRARGVRKLHLGGGVTADPADTLLAYKASFGGALLPTYTYGRVFDQVAYDDLSGRKIELERAKFGRESTSTYWPVHLRDEA